MVRWSESESDNAPIFESAFVLVDGEVVVEGDIVLGTLAEVQREHDRLSAQGRRDASSDEDKAFLCRDSRGAAAWCPTLSMAAWVAW